MLHRHHHFLQSASVLWPSRCGLSLQMPILHALPFIPWLKHQKQPQSQLNSDEVIIEPSICLRFFAREEDEHQHLIWTCVRIDGEYWLVITKWGEYEWYYHDFTTGAEFWSPARDCSWLVELEHKWWNSSLFTLHTWLVGHLRSSLFRVLLRVTITLCPSRREETLSLRPSSFLVTSDTHFKIQGRFLVE